MAKSFSFQLLFESEKPPYLIEGVISDDDWNIFLDYDECYVQLTKSGFFKHHTPISYKLSWKRDVGGSEEVSRPGLDESGAPLLLVRPFLLESEPTHIYSVGAKITKTITDENIRSAVKRIRSEFDGKNSPIRYELKKNGVRLKTESFVMTYLNAFVYHKDKEKQAEVAVYRELLSTEEIEFMFWHYMIEKLNAITNLSGLIQVILGKYTGYKIDDRTLVK